MVLKRLAALLFSVLLSVPAHAADTYVLKFATLAPQGSTWMNIITDWAGQVAKESGGRLTFKLYGGGVSGDEPDVLRKIRFGQLQGAAMTGHGIGYIYSPARVLEIPFLFRDYAEVDYVRAQLMPEIRAGFHDNGFELLGWMEVGFVQLFSREPIHSLEDMKKRRIWLWQGDPLGDAFFDASGLSPVPLPITEVFTSLSTGLIDTTIAPPLGAIAFQWFTKTPYMTDIPVMDGIGGLIVSRQFFDRLPPDLQALLRRTGEAAGERLVIETRRDNARSLAVLKQHGITFTREWQDPDAELYALRDRAAAALAKNGYIPAAIYRHARDALADYRARHAPAAKP
jgi:TRAP-type C4-dicarboxylate transport system substrate-binding protein